MDNGTGRGSFYAILALYRRQAYIVIAVGLGFGLFSGWRHFDVAAALLFASATLAWLFVTWLSMVYESWLQSKYPLYVVQPFSGVGNERPTPMPAEWIPENQRYIGPSNYTSFRQLVTEVLAFFTVLSFVAGLIAMLAGLLET